MPSILQIAALAVPPNYRGPADLDIVQAHDARSRTDVALGQAEALVTHALIGMPEALWAPAPILQLIASFGAGTDRIPNVFFTSHRQRQAQTLMRMADAVDANVRCFLARTAHGVG